MDHNDSLGRHSQSRLLQATRSQAPCRHLGRLRMPSGAPAAVPLPSMNVLHSVPFPAERQSSDILLRLWKCLKTVLGRSLSHCLMCFTSWQTVSVWAGSGEVSQTRDRLSFTLTIVTFLEQIQPWTPQNGVELNCPEGHMLSRHFCSALCVIPGPLGRMIMHSDAGHDVCLQPKPLSIYCVCCLSEKNKALLTEVLEITENEFRATRICILCWLKNPFEERFGYFS